MAALTAAVQAALYYARKKRRAVEEMTAGHGGGMREHNHPLGVTMTVTLTLQ